MNACGKHYEDKFQDPDKFKPRRQPKGGEQNSHLDDCWMPFMNSSASPKWLTEIIKSTKNLATPSVSPWGFASNDPSRWQGGAVENKSSIPRRRAGSFPSLDTAKHFAGTGVRPSDLGVDGRGSRACAARAAASAKRSILADLPPEVSTFWQEMPPGTVIKLTE